MHLHDTCNVQYLLRKMSKDVDDCILIPKAVGAVIMDCRILKDTSNVLSTSPDSASLIMFRHCAETPVFPPFL